MGWACGSAGGTPAEGGGLLMVVPPDPAIAVLSGVRGSYWAGGYVG